MQTVLLPAIDAAPMHDNTRLNDARRDLQIADERFAVERQLDDFERRIEMLCGLPEDTQRMSISSKLARRCWRRVAADTTSIEAQHVEVAKLRPAGTRGCALIAFGFIS